MELWLNGVGLILNTIGALLLYFFGVAPLRVTASGEGVITWTNSPSCVDRERNKHLYTQHRRWSQGGLRLLVIGFLFQLMGALWPHWNIPAGDTPSMKITPELITAWATFALAVLTLVLVGVSFWIGRHQINDSKAVANLEVTFRLTREYHSEEMRTTRDTLASQLLGSGVQPRDAEGLLDFLETVGHLAHQDLVNKDLLWNELSFPVFCYWSALEPYVRQRRVDYHDDSVYEEAEWLYQSMLQRERKRRNDPAYRVPETARAEFFRAETTTIVPPLEQR